jgi:fumarate hydratase subunit beta
MLKEVTLSTPLTIEKVKKLKAGDVVYLNGIVYQLRFPAHLRALQYAKKKERLPFDMRRAVIYHVYSSVTRSDNGFHLNYLGATTSSLLNRIEPEVIRAFQLGGIIGKGGMDKACLDAMREVGCIYLAQVGGASALYTARVIGVSEAHWLDMGSEMVLGFQFNKFGPLVVGMDAFGNSLYEQVQARLRDKLPSIYESLEAKPER